MGRRGRSSEGRKKIETKKVESEDACQVCFSKRKKGVFAKAAELSTMCGAEVALLIHSPKGTPYTFSSPSVDKVFNQFLTGDHLQGLIPKNPHEIDEINLLSEEYMELTKQLEAADARREALEKQITKRVVSRAKMGEWLDNIDELGRDQLLQLLGSMYRTKCLVNERIHGNYCYGGAGPSDMDVFTGMPPDAGMDLSLTPPALDSPDESSNF